MKKWTIIENALVEKLIFGWKWLTKTDDGKKIIISWWVIPGSVVDLKIIKNKSKYLEAQVFEVKKKSLIEEDLPPHFQVYWWCKWLPIKHSKQLEIKEEQVKESFNHIKDFIVDTVFHPIIPSPDIYWYRNKLEFSFGKYISAKEDVHDDFRFGFHKQWEFDKIINCDYCVLADDEINAIFKKVDIFARSSGLPTYDQKTQIGFWRHLVIRKSFYTQEIMLIFSINSDYESYNRYDEWKIRVFVNNLTTQFENIKSVYLLYNTWKADIVTGDYELIFGRPTIKEKILEKTFEINPKSFFQTNSKWAEVLYAEVIRLANVKEKSNSIALDLYAGTGTIWILLAPYFSSVYSVEVVKEASQDWLNNAKINGISNVQFVNSKTEDFLSLNPDLKPELLIVDPPRDWMHPNALPNIISFNAKSIIYVSCNPSTLARDLDFILKNSIYQITDVTPVDMFPHTHHIETIVRLELKK